MSTHAVRIIVQLLLAGPALLLLPISLVVSGAALYSFAIGDNSGVVIAVMVFQATLAFSALLASIVMPVAAICTRRWLLWSVRIFLGLGILMASVLLISNPWTDIDAWGVLQFVWSAVGALVVACWNLYRMQVYRPEPVPPAQAPG